MNWFRQLTERRALAIRADAEVRTFSLVPLECKEVTLKLAKKLSDVWPGPFGAATHRFLSDVGGIGFGAETACGNPAAGGQRGQGAVRVGGQDAGAIDYPRSRPPLVSGQTRVAGGFAELVRASRQILDHRTAVDSRPCRWCRQTKTTDSGSEIGSAQVSPNTYQKPRRFTCAKSVVKVSSISGSIGNSQVLPASSCARLNT